MKGVKDKGSERSEGPSLNYAQNLVAPSSVARQACCCANGSPKQLSLGDEGRWRDWRDRPLVAPMPR